MTCKYADQFGGDRVIEAWWILVEDQFEARGLGLHSHPSTDRRDHN
jgi:hypothetical protein